MEDALLHDGFVNLEAGQHSGRAPIDLALNQYSHGYNVAIRDGRARTRPPFKDVDVTHTDFETGLFQGCEVLRLADKDVLVAAIAGHIVLIDLDAGTVTDLGLKLSATASICYFCQAENTMIVQDGTTDPFIIGTNFDDDLTQVDYASTLCAGTNPLPKGTVMAYGHDRISVALEGQYQTSPFTGSKYFAVGDLRFPNNPVTMFSFDDTETGLGGVAFGLPQSGGKITAMVFMRNTDQTASGIGELIVFGRDVVSAFFVNAPRADWPNIQISQCLFSGAGTLSPRAIVPVNGDIFYRGRHGLRSIAYSYSKIARNEGGLANNPMSVEVDDLMRQDSMSVLPYVSAAWVNDRYFCTAVESTENGEPVFRALVSLDGSAISQMGSTSAPAFDGAWTGLNVLQVMRADYDGQERLLAFVKNGTSNRLVYLDEDTTSQYDRTASPTQCRLHTKAYLWQEPIKEKSLRYVDMWISEVIGEVSITVYWRPYGYELWNQMGTITISAAGLKQRRRQMRFYRNGDVYDPIDERPLWEDRAFEFCVQWTGRMTINQFTAGADITEVDPNTQCDVNSSEQTLAAGDAGAEINNWDYSIF